MCIIIYAPKGNISKKHLLGALQNNRDGWGVMWPEDGKVQIVQGLTDNQFFHNWKWINKKPGPKVFHARISTHGGVNLDNCHPFMVPQHGQLAMAHNGIIYRQADKGPNSDTKNFVKNILSGLPVGFQDQYAYQELIGEYIGQSKLVFMNGDGDVDIINVDAGHWKDGNWYSNFGYHYTKPSKGVQNSCYLQKSNNVTTPKTDTGSTGMSVDSSSLPTAYLPKDEKATPMAIYQAKLEIDAAIAKAEEEESARLAICTV